MINSLLCKNFFLILRRISAEIRKLSDETAENALPDGEMDGANV